jgi:hypothetical protein
VSIERATWCAGAGVENPGIERRGNGRAKKFWVSVKTAATLKIDLPVLLAPMSAFGGKAAIEPTRLNVR